jgi:hypothetical protein
VDAREGTKLVSQVDEATLYDNSTRRSYYVVARLEAGAIADVKADAPAWARYVAGRDAADSEIAKSFVRQGN